VAGVLFFASFWVVLAAGITAVWLTEGVRVIGLVIVSTAIVAGLLVVYFDWRARLLSGIRDERHGSRKAA
jgi:predicted ABC-type sugar transport system permease subunit